jgi:hypothetical protein
MKFSSQCKTAQKFKADALSKSPEAVEFFKNIHIPNCPKCRKHVPAAIAPKVSGSGDRFTVRSFSDPKKTYVVTKQGKTFRCSCPRWIYSDHKTDCKHIQQIKQLKKAA